MFNRAPLTFRFIIAVGLAASCCALTRADQPAASAPAASAPAAEVIDWTRSTTDDTSTTLEIASREYRPKSGTGPIVHLVGAIHVGEKSYYEALQKHLDAMDLVMFEGVKPGALQSTDNATDEDRATITTARIRLLAMAIEKSRAKEKKLPDSLDAFAASASNQVKRLIETCRVDGWQKPLTYSLSPGGSTFDIISFGADGASGGDGARSDLKLSAQKPLSDDEKGASVGIQQKMATALDLQFQMTGINYDRANWVNSDMSMEALATRMKSQGQSIEPLMKMMDGSSPMAGLAGVFLGMIKSNPRMQTMVKMMLVNTLGAADDAMGNMPGNMGTFFKVIVEDRNQVVMHDLQKIVKDQPNLKSIGVFYGAGHLPGMDKDMLALGYERGPVTWFKGVVVDLKAAGITPAEAAQYKKMAEQMLKAQSGQGRNRAKPAAAPSPAKNPEPAASPTK